MYSWWRTVFIPGSHKIMLPCDLRQGPKVNSQRCSPYDIRAVEVIQPINACFLSWSWHVTDRDRNRTTVETLREVKIPHIGMWLSQTCCLVCKIMKGKLAQVASLSNTCSLFSNYIAFCLRTHVLGSGPAATYQHRSYNGPIECHCGQQNTILLILETLCHQFKVAGYCSVLNHVRMHSVL